MTERIYLAGPILDRMDNGMSWRKEVKDEYDAFQWTDPLDKYVATDGEWPASRIVREDLAMIDRADGLFVYYDGERSFGTMMEIFYAAHVQSKPVVVVWAADIDVSPWIEHHTVAVTETIQDGVFALGVFFDTDSEPVDGDVSLYDADDDIEDIRADRRMLSHE